MRVEIFSSTYFRVFSEHGILEGQHDDGVAVLDTSTEDELKALYEALRKHFQPKEPPRRKISYWASEYLARDE